MLKREWVRKTTGSYRTYLSLVKLQTLVPEFAVEDVPLDRIATLVSAVAVKDCSWAEHSDDMKMCICLFISIMNLNKYITV